MAARRDRLDAAIAEMARDAEFAPVVHRLGCLRGISTLTGFALATEIGDWHRFTGDIDRRVRRADAQRVLLRWVPGAGSDHQDRQPARASTVGRGGLAPPRPLPSPEPNYAAGGTWPPRRPGPAATPVTGGCINGGSDSSTAANGPPWPPWPSRGNWPAGAGRWPLWTDPVIQTRSRTRRGDQRVEPTREIAMSSSEALIRNELRSILDTRNNSSRTTVLR